MTPRIVGVFMSGRGDPFSMRGGKILDSYLSGVRRVTDDLC